MQGGAGGGQEASPGNWAVCRGYDSPGPASGLPERIPRVASFEGNGAAGSLMSEGGLAVPESDGGRV